MGPLPTALVCQTIARQTFLVTRPKTRTLSVLAQKVEQATRNEPQAPIKPEPRRLQHPEPYSLVAPELSHLRRSLLNLLGSAHPGLTEIAEYYFLHPSKQLRSLLVLLISQATNGLGKNWEQKQWEAQRDDATGRTNELNRPLTTPDVLDDWNKSMPDHASSFSSVFGLRCPTPYPEPSIPPIVPIDFNLPPHLASPSVLLPTQIRLAQIAEMIHVASLLHDGIVNQSDGQPQQNDSFGNKLSILGGDFLLGRASTALSRLGESEVVELIASVISNQVEGEILRMDEVRTPALGLIEGPKTMPEAWNLYLRKTYLKTASLMAKSARAAVILGGSRDSEAWKEIAYVYGRNLGIAYQVLFCCIFSCLL